MKRNIYLGGRLTYSELRQSLSFLRSIDKQQQLALGPKHGHRAPQRCRGTWQFMRQTVVQRFEECKDCGLGDGREVGGGHRAPSQARRLGVKWQDSRTPCGQQGGTVLVSRRAGFHSPLAKCTREILQRSLADSTTTSRGRSSPRREQLGR